MSNMSYCRFRNTLEDFRDCADNWCEIDHEDNPDEDELRARRTLYRLAQEIVNDFDLEDL